MLTINAGDLPRFMACNGSVRMPVATPASASDTAQRDEGTAAHYMAAAVFNGQKSLEELIDRKAPNGVFMTAEMAQHVQGYLEHCMCDVTTFKAMECDTSHDRSPHWVVNGRADFAAQLFNTTLRVTDFKYGWRIVEPENNWTLISHAIGIVKQRGFQFSNVELQIFQPRPYHPDGTLRTWRIDANTLSNLDKQLDATLTNPADALNTNGSCGTCQANALCPAARRAEMNAIDACDTVFSDTVSNEYLSFSLDNLNRAQDMIKQRLAALGELAKHRIAAGQVVENYSVKMGLGNSVFKEGLDGPMLKVITGKDLTISELVTPAEAKRRGVSEDVLKTLTTRPTKGVQLERVKASKKAARLLA
jgi:hypothetical protein